MLGACTAVQDGKEREVRNYVCERIQQTKSLGWSIHEGKNRLLSISSKEDNNLPEC